jgi:hypothetical protein
MSPEVTVNKISRKSIAKIVQKNLRHQLGKLPSFQSLSDRSCMPCAKWLRWPESCLEILTNSVTLETGRFVDHSPFRPHASKPLSGRGGRIEGKNEKGSEVAFAAPDSLPSTYFAG